MTLNSRQLEAYGALGANKIKQWEGGMHERQMIEAQSKVIG